MLLLGNGDGRYHSCVTLMRDDNHACPQSALTAYAVLSALKWGAKVNGKVWSRLANSSSPITTHYTQDNQGLTYDTGISAHMSSVGIRNNGKGSFDPFPLNLFELKCRSLQWRYPATSFSRGKKKFIKAPHRHLVLAFSWTHQRLTWDEKITPEGPKVWYSLENGSFGSAMDDLRRWDCVEPYETSDVLNYLTASELHCRPISWYSLSFLSGPIPCKRLAARKTKEGQGNVPSIQLAGPHTSNKPIRLILSIYPCARPKAKGSAHIPIRNFYCIMTFFVGF